MTRAARLHSPSPSVLPPSRGLGADPLPQPKPIKRGVASFWTSPEPTFDEGTYQRISAAMLSYSAIEVRGGWPSCRRASGSRPARSGPEVALLRERLAVTDDLPPESQTAMPTTTM